MWEVFDCSEFSGLFCGGLNRDAERNAEDSGLFCEVSEGSLRFGAFYVIYGMRNLVSVGWS